MTRTIVVAVLAVVSSANVSNAVQQNYYAGVRSNMITPIEGEPTSSSGGPMYYYPSHVNEVVDTYGQRYITVEVDEKTLQVSLLHEAETEEIRRKQDFLRRITASLRRLCCCRSAD
jgi:hypothetical protein